MTTAPIRIVEDVPPPARTVVEEIRNARAALATTAATDRNDPDGTRDAAVLLHWRLQRLVNALDAEQAVTR